MTGHGKHGDLILRIQPSSVPKKVIGEGCLGLERGFSTSPECDVTVPSSDASSSADLLCESKKDHLIDSLRKQLAQARFEADQRESESSRNEILLATVIRERDELFRRSEEAQKKHSCVTKVIREENESLQVDVETYKKKNIALKKEVFELKAQAKLFKAKADKMRCEVEEVRAEVGRLAVSLYGRGHQTDVHPPPADEKVVGGNRIRELEHLVMSLKRELEAERCNFEKKKEEMSVVIQNLHYQIERVANDNATLMKQCRKDESQQRQQPAPRSVDYPRPITREAEHIQDACRTQDTQRMGHSSMSYVASRSHQGVFMENSARDQPDQSRVLAPPRRQANCTRPSFLRSASENLATRRHATNTITPQSHLARNGKHSETDNEASFAFSSVMDSLISLPWGGPSGQGESKRL
eukprot:CAMPEP_0113551504 /NCGR_PEP_ID=MMETSP0015_2-20120614/14560_1 /TAXON_ID=2838 /ORGANISM="Odontella" /LENGTH=411 /DNA_ID=CAMNT_0000452401 /DNA_START=140 /DNA_END=1375 /DNA_ORIENTATION=+ /assembly_acc=CAM_ASM_000160